MEVIVGRICNSLDTLIYLFNFFLVRPQAFCVFVACLLAKYYATFYAITNNRETQPEAVWASEEQNLLLCRQITLLVSLNKTNGQPKNLDFHLHLKLQDLGFSQRIPYQTQRP